MKKSRVGMIAGLLTLTLMASGCSLTGGQWAAKVNDEIISVKTLNQFADDAKAEYEKQGMDFSGDNGDEALKELKAQVLERLIETNLIAQEIKKLNLSADDPRITEQETKIKENFGNNEDYLNQTLKLQAMDRTALTNFLVLYTNITQDVQVTDDDVKAYFDLNKDTYGQPEKVRASHILVETEDEAKSIIAELDNGADFAELAKTKSTDTGSAQNGGDLDYFSKGDMVAEFEEAAFTLEPGKYTTTPVKTDYGYHIIKVVDHQQAVPADFETVKDQVKADALVKAQDSKYEEYMNNIYTNSTIEYAAAYKPAE